MADHAYLTAADEGVYVDVHVQPGAHRPRIVGRHGDALKMAVAAPPVGGRANEAVVKAIAEVLGVAAGDVTVTTGDTSRRKRLFVSGIDEKTAQTAFDAALADSSKPGRR
jgi:uncharacterized protein (TIGR00251 family)